jgi:hypothetical protein
MPPVTRVPAKKQALPGPMRIALEGSPGAWLVFGSPSASLSDELDL